MLNLDTHMLVAMLAGNLTEKERARLLNEPLGISDIVLWELAMLVRAKRLDMDLDAPEFHAALRDLVIFPITLEIAQKSTTLDFSSDPADEIIAATSVVENIPLLTRDRRIRKSRLVPLAV